MANFNLIPGQLLELQTDTTTNFFKLAATPAKIQIRHLSNTRQKRYHLNT
jgi:hypothetical protein